MASIRKRGRKWLAEVWRNGQREGRSFATKADAAAWALEREAELTGKQLPRKTLGDALADYATKVSPTKRGERWELLRLAKWQRADIARRPLSALGSADIAEWRDDRLKKAAPGTVAREMNLLRSVLEIARKEWGWINANPMTGVKRPTQPAARRRRVSDDESSRIVLALGYLGGEPTTISHRIALAWLFALETAMRAGEITGLTWADVNLPGRYVRLPRTKNGDQREVPLSSRAVEIIGLLPRDGAAVFGLGSAQRDALFRKARDATGIADLRFHDSRAEAIWRLSKKLDVLQLARVIGHRDIKSLMLYFNETATDLAARLG